MSAGVDDPSGLGDGETLGGGAADGEGGSRSDMPSLCSDVTVGICATLALVLILHMHQAETNLQDVLQTRQWWPNIAQTSTSCLLVA